MEKRPENEQMARTPSPEVIVTPSDMARLLHDQANQGFATIDDFDEGFFDGSDGLPPVLPKEVEGEPVRYFQINIDQMKTHRYMTPSPISQKAPLIPVTQARFPSLPKYMFKDGYLQVKDNIICAMFVNVYEKLRNIEKSETRLRYQSLIPKDKSGLKDIPVKDEDDSRFREDADCGHESVFTGWAPIRRKGTEPDITE